MKIMRTIGIICFACGVMWASGCATTESQDNNTTQNNTGPRPSRPLRRFMPKIVAAVAIGKKIATITFNRCAAAAIPQSRDQLSRDPG